MTEIRLLDLCAGAGGMSFGCAQGGILPTGAVEIDADACSTYHENLPGVRVYQEDIFDFSCSRKDFEVVRVVVGGLPCQPWSRLNVRKKMDDERRILWQPAIRIAHEAQADVIIFENVDTILDDRDTMDAMRYLLKELGYHVTVEVLNAVDFGIPQLRARTIIVASKKPFIMPVPTVCEPVTVGEAFAQLEGLPNEDIAKHKPETIDRIRAIQTYEWTSLTPGKDYSVAYRLQNDLPARPIANITKIYPIHPTEDRVISMDEAKVLQGLPTNYKILGRSRGSRAKQIGNLVPPGMMKAVAEQVVATQFDDSVDMVMIQDEIGLLTY